MKKNYFRFYLKSESFYTVFEVLGTIALGINIVILSFFENHESFLCSIILGLPLFVTGPLVYIDSRKGVHTMLGGSVLWGFTIFHSLIYIVSFQKIYPIFIILVETLLSVLLIYINYNRLKNK